MQSTFLRQTRVTFDSRFAEAAGTNPEELIAAAHASCFVMKLSFVLGEAGFTADTIETTAYTYFEFGRITGLQLVVKAKITGISQEVFEACVTEAKIYGPVGQLLNTEISIEAMLVE